eukprot:Seg385.25 transcript_id=Seg385.25/GoldUCD/mRNA.D3Y31 product="Beta-1 adrenergic receptor" protein_id=Seg385.25/GoldUCD/D3Y31
MEMEYDNTKFATEYSFLALFSILGIIGNSIIITVIWRKFKPESLTYLLICHLAFCDLLTCLFVGPLYVSAIETGSFLTCQITIFMTCAPVLCSWWTLVLIAYERYIYIKYPLRYTLMITTKRIAYLICLLWASSVTLASAVVSVNFARLGGGLCLPTLMISRWLMGTYFVLFFLLPIILMSFVYTYILKIALQQQRRVAEFANVADKRARTEKLRKERRTILMLYMVVFAYVFCISPFCLVALLDAIDPNIIKGNRGTVYNVAMLWFINAVMNPLLYALTNKELRRELRNLLAARRRIGVDISNVQSNN